MVALQSPDGSTVHRRWETARLAMASRQPDLAAVVVDIPIGLPDSGPRRCDQEARRLLGWPRSSSIFSAPARALLAAATYQEALALQRHREGGGISRQAFGIMAKIREIDTLLADGPAPLYEGHPELSFLAMGAGASLASKHTAAGQRQRRQLLEPAFGRLDLNRWGRPAEDILDAYACLWTARRLAEGRALWLPRGQDQVDPARSLAMRIYF